MTSTVLLIALGAVLLSALQAAVRHLRTPAPSCSWCSRASGHEVAGHTAEQCRGPRLAEEQRAAIDAAHQRDLARSTQELAEVAARKAAEAARHSTRLRIEHIGTVTTRGREIHITGWQFSTLPHGVQPTRSEAFTSRDRSEKIHGWTVHELHAMAHGGACTCDVVRLAKTLR